MRQRTMLDLGGVRGVSFWPRLTMKVSESFSHPELCSTYPHFQDTDNNTGQTTLKPGSEGRTPNS